MQNLMQRLMTTCTVPAMLLLMLSGCTVAPWERGHLAKSHMQVSPYPMQSKFRAHNYMSREAAPAASTSGLGGGCGCY